MCKRILCMILSFIFIFSCTILVNAQSDVDSEVQPEISLLYEFTELASSQLSISGNTAYCSSSLYGFYSQVSTIRTTMYLEKKTLWWWNEVTFWSAGFNDYKSTLSKTYEVDSGTYRVKTVFEVYSGSEFETITTYSSQVQV